MAELQEKGQLSRDAVRIDARAREPLGDLQGREPGAAAVSCTLELFHLAKQVAERTVQIAQDRKPFIVAVDVARRAFIQRSFTSSSRGMPVCDDGYVERSRCEVFDDLRGPGRVRYP